MDWKSTALEELDMLKLEDGIKIHESTKVDLDIYSRTNKVKLVKPFVLVVVGYEIMLEENTQCIASALRNAIINLDMVPKLFIRITAEHLGRNISPAIRVLMNSGLFYLILCFITFVVNTETISPNSINIG